MGQSKSKSAGPAPGRSLGVLAGFGAFLLVGAWLASIGSGGDAQSTPVVGARHTPAPVPSDHHTQASRTQHAQIRRDEDAVPVLEWVDIPAGNVALLQWVPRYNGTGVRIYRIPAFRLMKKEVTNAQYTACVRAGGCDPVGSHHSCKQFDYRDWTPGFLPGKTNANLKRWARNGLYDTCTWVGLCPKVHGHNEQIFTEFPWEVDGSPPAATRHPEQPVVCISVEQAIQFADWIGEGARLPLLTEWYYAFQEGMEGANEGQIPPGDTCKYGNVADQSLESLLPRANHSCTDSFVYTSPPGFFPPNHFGIHDLLGNASEFAESMTEPWLSERLTAYSGHASALSAGTVGAPESDHVTMGDSWRTPSWYGCRRIDCQDSRSLPADDIGFRLAAPAHMPETSDSAP